MSILVTGHKGYIGTNLFKTLRCRRQHDTQPIGCDIKCGTDFADITGKSLDTVVHLAASVSVVESFKNPDYYLLNNFFKVQRFLQDNKVERMIFISTGGAMYGESHKAKEEQANWNKCVSPYAQSKFLAEQVVRELCPNHVILRLGNVFGGDMSVRTEPSAHACFEKDDPIVVYGKDAGRDFVHVDVVCEAIKRAMYYSPQAQGTFNIGSGVCTPVLTIAREIAIRRHVEVEVRPHRTGEIVTIGLDITKAINAGLISQEEKDETSNLALAVR